MNWPQCFAARCALPWLRLEQDEFVDAPVVSCISLLGDAYKTPLQGFREDDLGERAAIPLGHGLPPVGAIIGHRHFVFAQVVLRTPLAVECDASDVAVSGQLDLEPFPARHLGASGPA